MVRFKVQPTVGACGIDCGMCPRYVTTAASRCPGCAPAGFLEMGGQWCKFTRCAVRERGYETCAECGEFPCHRFAAWDEGDSFVSHLNSVANLRRIKQHGLESFLEEQQARIAALKAMLSEFDEGRSKSYCCRAATLLPLSELKGVIEDARKAVCVEGLPAADLKARARILHRTIDGVAEELGICLKLRNAGH